jgi:ABC-type phosphate transport system substrate-binding protein
MRNTNWLGRKATKVALAAAVVGGVGISMAAPASADYAPAPLDVVGAGSDTVQNIMNFVADGLGSTDGFNTAGNKYKLVSLDATGDANDRAVYPSGGTTPLKLSVAYRAGKSPQQRANGSGAGIAALLADTTVGAGETINFVRMSRFPNSGEITTANGLAGWGGLHAIKIATDDLVMAAAAGTTNAVPLTGAQLAQIYTCAVTDWHTFNAAAPVGSTIYAEAPQPGSGTGSSFLSDISNAQVAAGGASISNFGGCVHIGEENDPLAIANLDATNKPNAIQPMSDGRKGLYDNGYFHDPSSAFPSNSALTSGVQLLYGTQTANACQKPTNPSGPGNALAYCNTRGLYIVWRAADDTFGTPWQPGTTRNWVQTLFWRPSGQGTPHIKTSLGQSEIGAGGVQPTYVDCGILTTATTC